MKMDLSMIKVNMTLKNLTLEGCPSDTLISVSYMM